MSFTEVLAELPALTVAERQEIVRRAIELDSHILSNEDEVLIQKRLSDHQNDPATAISLDEMKNRLRSLFAK